MDPDVRELTEANNTKRTQNSTYYFSLVGGKRLALPAHICTGSNTWKRLCTSVGYTAIQGKGLWGHFDGTSPRPELLAPDGPQMAPSSGSVSSTQGTTTVVAVSLPHSGLSSPAVTFPLEIETWDRGENIARALLAQWFTGFHLHCC